nr:MAG TPA: hypothetical protein [Caudoviricetes sp.]
MLQAPNLFGIFANKSRTHPFIITPFLKCVQNCAGCS